MLSSHKSPRVIHSMRERSRRDADFAYCDEQLHDYGMTVRRVELTGRGANGRNRYQSFVCAPLTAFSL